MTIASQPENPYEPPQSRSALPPRDPHRPIGIVGWIVIVPLALLASAVAFVCTLYPLVMTSQSPSLSWLGDVAPLLSLLVSLTAGLLVGWGLKAAVRLLQRLLVG
ncbi:hypothetical protein Pla175_06820 [Pirellulimonas nuda]|uniref:Uncharacterized protein n=1 Tax=Pirellulimonas nuda TaxID=2528009 RepID=A0A518D763_9BACT|nr:hypothetical protein [Pirellulimonas nuda]QDU87323.1 hypothetical protein Pla175_06820 [Pirellulimonas nuda]